MLASTCLYSLYAWLLYVQTVARTVRDYQPAYDIETLKQQPMLATLDPAALDQLYRQLECQLGNAYNCRSFDASSCSRETLVSPLSTVRAASSTVTASSVLPPDDGDDDGE